jgi:outer membrane protein TolC
MPSPDSKALSRAVRALAPLALVAALAPAALAQAPHTMPATIDTLDLRWLERTVLERNPSLAALRAASRAAAARASGAGALPDPAVGFAIAPGSYGSDAVQDAWRIEVEQSFPLFGQRGLERRAAQLDASAALQDLEIARLDLVRETRQAYFDYYHADRTIDVAGDLLQIVQRAREAALSRYASGRAGQQDVLQADAEIAMLEHERVVAERDRRIVEARLRALLHWEAGRPLAGPPSILPVPDRALLDRVAVAERDSTWPELKAADARVAAERARLDFARRRHWPETTFGYTYDRYWAEPEMRNSITASINLPLGLGRISDGEHEAAAELERSTAMRDAARDQIERRLAEASTRFGEALHEVDIMRGQLVPATERALSALRAGYETNRTDFMTLIDGVRSVARARLELHRALAGANAAAADLERALGGPPPADGE